MFPLPYYEYNAGTLISNDAQSLETVGFNQWDEEWEVGNINGRTGEKQPESGRIRSKNLFPAFGGVNYYMSIPSSYKIRPFYYDTNKNFISTLNGYIDAGIITTPTNCTYMLFSASATYGAVYNHDICINLSDPDKNGTYEPYWKSSLPLGLDYLPIKSHNIWDEEWENGIYVQGVKSGSSNTRIRCKNSIKCFPSTIYYIGVVGDKYATTLLVQFLDADGNYISGENITHSTFTTPSNCYSLVFCTPTDYYGGTYNHDICINTSDPDFNGQYEPYALRGGLKGAGSVYDLGRVEDDGYIHEVTKVMSEVDLGKLDWAYESIHGTMYAPYPSDAQNASSSAAVANILCAKYETKNYNSVYNGTIGIAFTGQANLRVSVYDSAYTDATTFKTAMSGVMLYYELATPITYELVTPIKAIYKVDKRGTEQATFPTHSDGSPSAPLCAEIGYPK